jgi:pantoate--beta-alanine ligase
MQVVAKLLHQVAPTRAYFGRKDWQQFSILSRMASELFFPVEMIGCPIVREPDGLAMSSRNRYLNPEERQQALFLSVCLNKIAEQAREGNSPAGLLGIVQDLLPQFPLIRLDYADIRRQDNLEEVQTLSASEKPRAFIAAWCGNTRLIDNRSVFDPEP